MGKTEGYKSKKIRVIVNDYGSYSFPIQLSRWLADQGYDVMHIYNKTEPMRGSLLRKAEDPQNLLIYGIKIESDFGKEDLFKRRKFERSYGKHLIKSVVRFNPDIIISANTPVETQFVLMLTARKHGYRFIYWVQDLRGIAAITILRKKIPILGAMVGMYYTWLERLQLFWSDHLILITEDFLPYIHRWAKKEDNIHVIPNWAPIEDFPVLPKENSWAEKIGLVNTFNFLYAGVLGMKHNPELLLNLAIHFKDSRNILVVVISHGPGADWLRKQKIKFQVDNLYLFDFQPFELMSQIIGSADVLVSILEPEAGIYSVPSKVQTYLCGKKPLLLSVPADNLITRIVNEVKGINRCVLDITSKPPGTIEWE